MDLVEPAYQVARTGVLTRLYETRLYGLDVVEGFMRQYGVLPQLDEAAHGETHHARLSRLWEWINADR